MTEFKILIMAIWECNCAAIITSFFR